MPFVPGVLGKAVVDATREKLREGIRGIESAGHSFAMRLASRLCLLLFLAWPSSAGFAEAIAVSGKPVPARDLFEKGEIPRVRLELPDDALEKLRRSPRTYVVGAVVEGTRRYTNVSIRLKGGPGSFRPLEDRPGFTINFDQLAPGQTFHGLKKLHLNNSVQDSSCLSEKLCREMFEAAGVPVPRAGHAVVELNDRPLGLYVLIEGVNKQFLKRYFSRTDGNVYDGHSQQDVNRRLRVNSGDTPQDQSRLADLTSAARMSDLVERRIALEKTLDVERFLSFLATEVIVAHWDGYSLNRNNFRIFHDLSSDRLVFLPHGLDQTFQRMGIEAMPKMSGLVAKSVLEVPEFRERFLLRESQLLTNTFQTDRWVTRLREVAAQVQRELEVSDPSASTAYISRAASFRRRIQRRFDGLRTELGP